MMNSKFPCVPSHTHKSFGLSVYNCATRNSKHTSLSRGCRVYIIASVPEAGMCSPWGARTLTQCQRWALFLLDASAWRHRSCWGYSGRSLNCLWNSNKGADLLLNRPHWVEGEYGVIELIHAVLPCSGRMIFIVGLLQLIKGKSGAGISKHFSLCRLKRGNGLWWEKKIHHYYAAANKEWKSFFTQDEETSLFASNSSL